MKYSRKKPGESGYKKTLDDLQESLDWPTMTENNKNNQETTITIKAETWEYWKAKMKTCPKGHFLKTSGGDCIFCRNWLEQIDKAFSGVPNKMGPYKRRDIGADYGGSGTLAGD